MIRIRQLKDLSLANVSPFLTSKEAADQFYPFKYKRLPICKLKEGAGNRLDCLYSLSGFNII